MVAVQSASRARTRTSWKAGAAGAAPDTPPSSSARPITLADPSSWPRPAIVTTLREVPAAMLESFCTWHLRLGFVRLYLYFDDPQDDGIAVARRLCARLARRGFGAACVRALPCDAHLRHEWGALHTYTRWSSNTEMVEVRQMLNAEHCLRLSHADGDVCWLLHIDSDELFHLSGGMSAPEHFGRLQANGCVNFVYPIHEGVPESADTANPFAEISLFRRHFSRLPGLEDGPADAEKREVFRAAWSVWVARRPRHPQCIFLGSSQGKSATRVLPGVRPISVHAFWPPEAQQVTQCWGGFQMNDSPYGEALRVARPSGSPCILHYISYSFDFWWRKYKLLGAFPDTKPGGSPAGGESMAGTFHCDSRDLVGSVERPAARARYTAQVCLVDAAEAERQVASGVCMRLDDVQRELRREAADAEAGVAYAPIPCSV